MKFTFHNMRIHILAAFIENFFIAVAFKEWQNIQNNLLFQSTNFTVWKFSLSLQNQGFKYCMNYPQSKTHWIKLPNDNPCNFWILAKFSLYNITWQKSTHSALCSVASQNHTTAATERQQCSSAEQNPSWLYAQRKHQHISNNYTGYKSMQF